jgi:hypothetical protein
MAMANDTQDRTGRDRRDFLKLASLGTVAGSAALVLGEAAEAATTAAEAAGAGYRETAHVRTYYDLARF